LFAEKRFPFNASNTSAIQQSVASPGFSLTLGVWPWTDYVYCTLNLFSVLN